MDVVLRSPVKQNSDDEVDVALTALAMLPVTVRWLSLACKRVVHPRFSELCPMKLISLAQSCKLISLDLPSNHIGDGGAAHLASLSNLTSLELVSNNIGNGGAAHLAALSNLTSLNLRGNNIGE